MPDIAMCRNRECPLRGTCYRYLAFPSAQQSYAKFAPGDAWGNLICLAYWSSEDESVRRVEDVDAEKEGALNGRAGRPRSQRQAGSDQEGGGKSPKSANGGRIDG